MTNAPEVICAGIIVADHGCSPLARLPDEGELMVADDLAMTIGGCAANVAVNLAKLGVRAEVVGRVGNDPLGRVVTDMLADEGISTSRVVIDRKKPTSQTLIVNVQGEDRRFIHAFGANATFRAQDIPLASVLASRVLYVGGYLLMDSMEPAELAAVFSAAQQGGVKTVLDVCVPGPGQHLAKLAPVLPFVDVFMPNDHEAASITGLSDPMHQAEALFELGPRTVIVTCGGRGTVVIGKSSRFKAGVYPTDFVDGSGGGDAFAAGYILGMLEGQDIEGCLRRGSALGASCVRRLGTTTGVFDRPACDAFMKQHSLPLESMALA